MTTRSYQFIMTYKSARDHFKATRQRLGWISAPHMADAAERVENQARRDTVRLLKIEIFKPDVDGNLSDNPNFVVNFEDYDDDNDVPYDDPYDPFGTYGTPIAEEEKSDNVFQYATVKHEPVKPREVTNE